MIDITEHAPEVLQQAELLLKAIKLYERTVAPAEYAPTPGNLLVFNRIAMAALTLENGLSKCDLLGPSAHCPVRVSYNVDIDVITALRLVNELCLAVRFSRHADTETERDKVRKAWGQEANGGWGFDPSKDKNLPVMGKYAERLAADVEMLREAIGPLPDGDKPKPLECNGQSREKKEGKAKSRATSEEANAVMEQAVDENPDRLKWSVREWQSHLRAEWPRISTSTIHKTAMWKQGTIAREKAKQERMPRNRGRRKPKHRSKY